MLVVGVVLVLERRLLGPVDPEVPVQAAVDDLPVLVHPRPPRVVPVAAHVDLLLVAHQVQLLIRVGLQELLGLGKCIFV